MQRSLLALFALALASSIASAQSKRGTWEGSAYWSSGSQRLVIVFDSAASGWSGTMVGETSADSTRLASVSVKADTVSFGIPYNGAVVSISGLVADGKFSGEMWFNNQNVGTVELTRKSENKKP